jgi:hypothetical protein
MNKVLIVMVSNRDMQPLTEESVRILRSGGMAFALSNAGSDVSQARNYSLSKACEMLREHPEWDLVFMMDDDIVVQPENVSELIEQTRRRQHACSMIYFSEDSKLCGGLWLKGGRFDDGTFKWRMGLGALMIPREQLLKLEADSESYETPSTGVLTEFTWSKAEAGEWVAEDYRLCQRLGGVHLLPLEAGHVKRVALWPHPKTLDTVRKFQTYTGPYPMPDDNAGELQAVANG